MASKTYQTFSQLMREGEVRKAVELAERQVLETGGRNEFWLTQLSRAHLENRQVEQALETSERALELDPANGYALIARAKALRAADRFTEALEVYREALRQSKVRDGARWGIMSLLVRTEQWQEVLKRLSDWSFPEVQPLRWRLKALVGLDRTKEARKVADQILEIEPDDRATLWELVEIEISELGLESVRDRYARLARIPSRPPIYGEIYASLCRRAGDEESAAKQYARMEHPATGTRIQRKRAFTLAKSNREQQALPIMEELLRTAPDDFYVHSAYVAACRRIGDLERAWNFYSELLKIHPDEKGLYGRRRRVANELGDPD